LPKNDAGYDVYLRALAKPTNSPNVYINPSLVWLQDEYGNDLYYLGTFGSTNYFSWVRIPFTEKKENPRVWISLLSLITPVKSAT